VKTPPDHTLVKQCCHCHLGTAWLPQKRHMFLQTAGARLPDLCIFCQHSFILKTNYKPGSADGFPTQFEAKKEA